jgi:DNA-binding GntR family transcriptional regulator
MVKLNVKRKLGRTVIDIGIQEIEDVNFARQLIEKGLATLVEGEIPGKEVREKVIKKVPKKKKKG